MEDKNLRKFRIAYTLLWEATGRIPRTSLMTQRVNDATIMEAYGFDKNLTEPQIINLLLQQYQKLIKQKR